MKHTPGPWSLCGAERGGCSCFTVGCGDHPIAHIEHGEWGDEYCDIRLVDSPNGIGKIAEAYMERTAYGEIADEYARGNGYLIAASPLAYDLAQEIVNHLYTDQDISRVRAMAKEYLSAAEKGVTE